MAKKKTPAQVAKTFNDIIKASVKGNPKPKLEYHRYISEQDPFIWGYIPTKNANKLPKLKFGKWIYGYTDDFNAPNFGLKSIKKQIIEAIKEDGYWTGRVFLTGTIKDKNRNSYLDIAE